MKAETMASLERLIQKKSVELGLHPIGNISQVVFLFAPRERFHFATELRSSVVPSLPLQIAIHDEEGGVRALLFPSPPILTEQTAEQFLTLANEANRELYRGAALGRFWLDIENLDFAYEVLLRESLVESHLEEAAAQLFDVPLSHFRDLHIPLVMLAGGTWNPGTALRFFRQLRSEGFVEHSDYGL